MSQAGKLTQYFILHKQKVFLLTAEQTGLDSADLRSSGMKRQKAGAIKSYIYMSFCTCFSWTS